MSKINPEKNIANKLIRYASLQHSVMKTLTNSGTMPLTFYHILYLLDQRGRMRMGEVAEILAISRPNLTPLVDKLHSLDHIERVLYGHDRRIIFLEITDAGRLALNKELDAAAKNLTEFPFSDDEYERFVAASDIITEMLSKPYNIAVR